MRAPLLLLCLSWYLSSVAVAAEARVAVATNFLKTARILASAFTQATPHRIVLSQGATGALFAQITQGAPYDVFLAADLERPRRALAQGLAEPGSLFVYARGRLVLWAPGAESSDDGPGWLRRSQGRLAMANPRIAPYGRAAREALEKLGLWTRLAPRLVQGTSVAQAHQFVATGNAAGGFLAASQLAGSPPRGLVWELPAELHAPIDQGAVLLRRGRDNAAARAFLIFLASGEGRRLIRAQGYLTPGND